MTCKNTKNIVVFSLVALFIFTSFGISNVYAEETEEKQYTKANNVAIHTVFEFRAGVEESDGFQVYKQMSGFDRGLESPAFKLEGVMDFDSHICMKLQTWHICEV